jgi:hypothetical protein
MPGPSAEGRDAEKMAGGRRGTGRGRSSRTLGVDEGGMNLRGEEVPSLGRGSAVQKSPGGSLILGKELSTLLPYQAVLHDLSGQEVRKE